MCLFRAADSLPNVCLDPVLLDVTSPTHEDESDGQEPSLGLRAALLGKVSELAEQ